MTAKGVKIMLDVISAPPGSGKSLWCVELLENTVRKNPNRMIFTNIIGINIPGVLPITSSANKPFDWRDCPDGSLIVFDEAHEHPAFAKTDLLKNFQLPAYIDNIYDMEVAKILDYQTLATTQKIDLLKKHCFVYTELPLTLKIKEQEELVRKVRAIQKQNLELAKENILDIGRSLTMHRHFGMDIVLVTQKPDLLNSFVKASCSKHLILRRIFNWQMAVIFTYSEIQDSFGNATRKNALSWRVWFFPKRLFKYYISAEQHTSSASYPLGLIAVALAFIGLVGYGVYLAMYDDTTIFQNGTPQNALNESTSNEKTTASNSPAATDKQQLQDLSNICRKAVNVDTPECKKWFDDLSKNGGSLGSAESFVYDGNKPFDVEYTPSDLEPTDFPRFKNAIVYNGKCTAYSQQGTIMHKVSKNDCFRLANGDRPFDYFAEEKRDVQPSSPSSDANYKKAYLENIARLDAERHMKAQDASINEEQIPLGTKPPQDITGANSL